MRTLVIHVLLLTALGVNAQARTWYVKPDGSGAAPTIQAAVDSALSGDEVLLAPGTYTWTSQLASGALVHMKPGLVLRGEAGAGATILDAESLGRVITCVDVGSQARIEDLTIQNGVAPRTSSNGIAWTRGGGIGVSGDSNPTIARCVIQNNRADGPNARGGGIHCDLATIQDCEILDNTCMDSGTAGGGGIECGAAIIERCLFRNNRSSAYDSRGAAVAGGLLSRSALVRGCVFEDNSTGGGVDSGGGGAIFESGVASIEDCRFQDNRASKEGGAIRAGGGSITGCLFVGNKSLGTVFSSPTGGAIRAGGPITISRCILVANVAHHWMDGPGYGGAVHVGSGTIELCTFFGNSGGTSTGVGGIQMDSGEVRTSILAGTTAGAACAGAATWSCCDLFGNAGGDAISGTDGGGNFSADPQFCASDPVSSLNITIQSDSPCAPDHHPDGASCGPIGAAAVGCGTVAVVSTTWSRLKILYRARSPEGSR